MLVFEERGKPEYPEKNLSDQRREPTTYSTHIWCRRQDLNPGHIGRRRALSSLHHPLLPYILFLALKGNLVQCRNKLRSFQAVGLHECPFPVWDGLLVYICVPRIYLEEQRVLTSIAYISVSCGSVVNNTLKSPAYSNGFYAASMSCVYNTSIPDGKAMRLKFQSFDLASDSECR